MAGSKNESSNDAPRSMALVKMLDARNVPVSAGTRTSNTNPALPQPHRVHESALGGILLFGRQLLLL